MNSEKRHKFLIDEEIKPRVPRAIGVVLEDFGIPQKILGFEYLFSSPYIDGDYLVLGTRKYSEEQQFRVCLSTGEVFHMWNFGKPEHVFLGSSLLQLLLCVFADENLVVPMIKAETLGKYSESHGKYSALLASLVGEIDPACLERGPWRDVIEEMENGVI